MFRGVEIGLSVSTIIKILQLGTSVVVTRVGNHYSGMDSLGAYRCSELVYPPLSLMVQLLFFGMINGSKVVH